MQYVWNAKKPLRRWMEGQFTLVRYGDNFDATEQEVVAFGDLMTQVGATLRAGEPPPYDPMKEAIMADAMPPQYLAPTIPAATPSLETVAALRREARSEPAQPAQPPSPPPPPTEPQPASGRSGPGSGRGSREP